jgi:hypothetical protein
MKTKIKKVKARKAAGCYGTELFALGGYMVGSRPYWLLPRDATSYDAMVYQMVMAADKKVRSNYWNIETARAALASIGITRPTAKENK